MLRTPLCDVDVQSPYSTLGSWTQVRLRGRRWPFPPLVKKTSHYPHLAENSTLRRRRPVEGRKIVAHGEAEGPERSRTGRRQAVGMRYSITLLAPAGVTEAHCSP